MTGEDGAGAITQFEQHDAHELIRSREQSTGHA
jgi:hypothetical protein